MLAGTPDDCISRLQELHEDWGIDYVVFCCRLSTGPSLEAAREQIARFGEQVVQPIHARYPAPDHPAIPPVLPSSGSSEDLRITVHRFHSRRSR